MNKLIDKIDVQPFLWFFCFIILIVLAMVSRIAAPDFKLVGDLLLLGAGSIAPRIRSSKPEIKS